MKIHFSLLPLLLITFLLLSGCSKKSEKQESHDLLKFSISLEDIEPDLNRKVESARVIALETKD